MNDEAIIQALVNGLSHWTHVGKETATFKRHEPRAREVLAFLRSEGWDLYRPADCAEGTVTPMSHGRGAVRGFYAPGTYRLVPTNA